MSSTKIITAFPMSTLVRLLWCLETSKMIQTMTVQLKCWIWCLRDLKMKVKAENFVYKEVKIKNGTHQWLIYTVEKKNALLRTFLSSYVLPKFWGKSIWCIIESSLHPQLLQMIFIFFQNRWSLWKFLAAELMMKKREILLRHQDESINFELGFQDEEDGGGFYMKFFFLVPFFVALNFNRL